MKYIFSILSTFLIAGVAVAGYDDPFYDFGGSTQLGGLIPTNLKSILIHLPVILP